MKAQLLAIFFVLFSMLNANAQSVDSVIVMKSDRKLQLHSGAALVKEYKISLGGSPTGHKEREGDQRTPEGLYVLDYKKKDSSFYRAIHISYPNQQDRANARAGGYPSGGLIMIHGQRNGLGWLGWLVQKFDWTDGCIALSNSDMSEVWKLVQAGTPIEIRP